MPVLEEMSYTVTRSRRKSVGIRLRPDGSFAVSAPLFMPEKELQKVLCSKLSWMRKAQKNAAENAKKAAEAGTLSAEEIKELAERALQVVPARVRYFAPLVGVSYGRITIRNQVSRWGSCSSAGNLNFNCLLMLAPSEVLDAVIVHELCHRKHMDHSEAFYAEVRRVYPSYDKWQRWLKTEGPVLMKRMCR